MTQDEVRSLYETAGYLVHRRCLVMLGNTQDANDALQETFVRILKYNPEKVESHLAWAYSIATRVCFDQLERRRRTEAWPSKVLTRLRETLPGQAVAPPELRVSLGDELRRLEPKVREMVLLCHLEGLTQEEVAQRTGYSRRWVGEKLRAAEAQLQAALAVAPIRAAGAPVAKGDETPC